MFKIISGDNIHEKINSIKKIYLVFAVIGVLFGAVAGILRLHSITEVTRILIYAVIAFSIYYGLKKKRSWTIPLVLIYSAYQLLIQALHNPFTLRTDIEAYKDTIVYLIFENVISGVLHLAIILFFAYQIYFFSKKEVRKFFEFRGTVIF